MQEPTAGEPMCPAWASSSSKGGVTSEAWQRGSSGPAVGRYTKQRTDASNNDFTAEGGPTPSRQEGKGQWMLAKSCPEEPQRETGRPTHDSSRTNEEQRDENKHALAPLGQAFTSSFLFNPYSSSAVDVVINLLLKMRK